jgi:membrane fusion protein, heavy metal efflux system
MHGFPAPNNCGALERDGMRSNWKMWNRAGCLFGFSASLWMAACHREPATSGTTNATVQSAESTVRYAAVAEQLIADRLELSAKVQADPARMFRVFPPASGRVLAIKVKPGDTVARGETLATLDSADAASAQSDLTKAQIEAERAQRAAEREKVLLDHGAIAEKDYIDAKAAADSANAELERAKRHVALLGINAAATMEGIPLLSPSRGVVLTVSAAPGEFSKSLDNADPLMTIADLSMVWIVGDIFEKDIAKVQPGMKVTVQVDAFPGRQWSAKISSVSGALDPTTRTLKVRAALDNPGEKLKPEMYATIQADVGTHRAIVVPSSAVIHEGQNVVVFVETGGQPEQRNVTTGQAVDGRVEIKSGLDPGQRVAVNGAELLTGGASQP